MIFRILVCLLFVIDLSAQSWQILANDYDYPVYQKPVELPNGNIFSVYNGIFTSADSVQMVLLSDLGNTIERQEYDPGNEKYEYKTALHIPDRELIAMFFSTYDLVPDSANQLLVTLMDYELNVVDEITWYNGKDFDIYDIDHITPLLLENGDLLLALGCNQSNFNYPNIIKYMKLNVDTGLYGYHEVVSSGDSILYAGNLVESWDNTKYISSHLFNIKVDSSLGSHTLDNLVYNDLTDRLSLGYTQMKRWHTGEYLLSDVTDLATAGHVLMVVNEQNEIMVKKVYIENPPGYINIPNVTYTMDYKYKDKVYMVGEQFKMLLSPSDYLWLDQYDEDLNKVWKMYFGLEDSAWWISGGVVATEDGGALISGMNGGDGDRRAFMIKIDAEGNLPTTTEDIPLEIIAIKAYPNPSSGILNIDVQSYKNTEYALQMYNQSGALVYESDALQIGNNSFDLTHLANGKYHYQLMSKEKVLLNEQWVKQD